MQTAMTTGIERRARTLTDQQVETYHRTGYHFPLPVMSSADAGALRAKLEEHEKRTGSPLAGSIRHKAHLLFPWLWDLIHHPGILDPVEDILGPNLLCWTTNFFIKEARDPGYVSWHQDATYWGLSTPDVITAWVAFSPSTIEAGAMRVAAGTHKEQVKHRDTFNKDNLLTRGQEVEVEVDESTAVDIVLLPGEMSLHHVLLVHGSEPNQSDDRRIGFAIRYIPTHVRQIAGPRDSAVLVRGVDEQRYFDMEPRPAAALAPEALEVHRAITERQAQILYRGTDTKSYDKVVRV